jgi:hypothetical protein
MKLPSDLDKLRAKILANVKVDPASGCWNWARYLNPKGYGFLWASGKQNIVHRVSYAAFVADPGPLCVLHRCDNPACVRPDHLFLGTVADNNEDMIGKGRHVSLRGERHGNAKLTADQVGEIKRLLADRVLQREIAERFGISESNLWQINTGKTWSHVAARKEQPR